MARRRKTYRRRRGRFAFLLKLVCFALILAALVGAMTAFFKVDQIIVSGQERYSSEEVLLVSGIREGDNLFLLNKYAAAQAIFEQLPYVESASIQRKLPDTLLISIVECRAAASIKGPDGRYLISAQGKILEKTSARPEDCTKVSGCTLLSPEISAAIAFAPEENYQCEALLKLLAAAEEKRIRGGIGEIDLSDGTCLQLSYLERFTVKLPWNADFAYKLESLATVVDYLEDNETGTINLLTDGKASFIPK